MLNSQRFFISSNSESDKRGLIVDTLIAGNETTLAYISKHTELAHEFIAAIKEPAAIRFLGGEIGSGTHRVVGLIIPSPESKVTADDILTVNAAMASGDRYKNIVEPTGTYPIGMIGLGIGKTGPQCVVVCAPLKHDEKEIMPVLLDYLAGGILALQGANAL